MTGNQDLIQLVRLLQKSVEDLKQSDLRKQERIHFLEHEVTRKGLNSRKKTSKKSIVFLFFILSTDYSLVWLQSIKLTNCFHIL